MSLWHVPLLYFMGMAVTLFVTVVWAGPAEDDNEYMIYSLVTIFWPVTLIGFVIYWIAYKPLEILYKIAVKLHQETKVETK